MEQFIERAARDMVNAKHAIALTGAGVSTESGIRDYRGPDGVWTKNPEAESKAYRTYREFMADPKGWWESVLTGHDPGLLGDLSSAMPNPSHYALVELENLGILKCLITQNIDGLHDKAGTKSLLEYHGNTFKLRCISCGSRFRREEFNLEELLRENQLPPRCPDCDKVLKSDIVFFGEQIPSDIVKQSITEARECDLMLTCGTSAVVYPFANLPRIVSEKEGVTIIEINAEPTPLTLEGISDYLIQGKTGEILPMIVEAVKQIINNPK